VALLLSSLPLGFYSFFTFCHLRNFYFIYLFFFVLFLTVLILFESYTNTVSFGIQYPISWRLPTDSRVYCWAIDLLSELWSSDTFELFDLGYIHIDRSWTYFVTMNVNCELFNCLLFQLRFTSNQLISCSFVVIVQHIRSAITKVSAKSSDRVEAYPCLNEK